MSTVSLMFLEGSTTSDAGEEVKRDQISGLHQSTRNFFLLSLFFLNTVLTGYRNLISSILNAAPPSDSAKSSNYPKSQLAYSIYDGRYRANKPRTSVAPPVQLFNPFFGHFLDHMRSDIAVPDDIVRRTWYPHRPSMKTKECAEQCWTRFFAIYLASTYKWLRMRIKQLPRIYLGFPHGWPRRLSEGRSFNSRLASWRFVRSYRNFFAP